MFYHQQDDQSYLRQEIQEVYTEDPIYRGKICKLILLNQTKSSEQQLIFDHFPITYI